MIWKSMPLGLRLPARSVAAVAALVSLASPALGTPTPGPPFELDDPIMGSVPAGQQRDPHAASGANGTVVIWSDIDDFYREQVGGAFLALGSTAPVPLALSAMPPAGGAGMDVAWAGSGFVVISAATDGVYALRLGPTGAVLDSVPLLLARPDASIGRACTVDVDCNGSGQCVVLWTECLGLANRSLALRSVGLGWNRTVGPVQTLAVPDTAWVYPSGKVTRSGSNFVAAYTEYDPTPLADGSHQRRVLAQALSPSGDPLQAANGLLSGTSFGDFARTGSNSTQPSVGSLGGGAAFLWTTFDGVLHLQPLDPLGAAAGPPSDLGTYPGEPMVSSEGATAVVFQNSGNTFRTDGTVQRFTTVAQRVDVNGPLAGFGVVAPAPADSSLYGSPVSATAFDGSGHWLFGTESGPSLFSPDITDPSGARIYFEDRVTAGYLPLPLKSVSSPPALQPLIAAANSQLGLVTASSPNGASGLAVWNDNRNGGASVYAVGIGADGCPITSPAPVFSGPGSRVLGVLADDNGFLVAVSEGQGATTPHTVFQRFGFNGLAVATDCAQSTDEWSRGSPEPVPVKFNCDPTVKFSSCPFSQPLGATQTTAGLVSVSEDGINNAFSGPLLSGVRLHYTDPLGNELKPDVLSSFPSGDAGGPLYGFPGGLAVQTDLGYVVMVGAGSEWFAGVISPQGDWSGLVRVPVPLGTRHITDVKAFRGDLVWLVVADRTAGLTDGGTGSTTSGYWLLRTSTALELRKLDDLGVPASNYDGQIGGSQVGVVTSRLVPGTSDPGVLLPLDLPPPRSVRIAGRRLDGLSCPPVPLTDRSDAGAAACVILASADGGVRDAGGADGASVDASDRDASMISAGRDAGSAEGGWTDLGQPAAGATGGGGCGCTLAAQGPRSPLSLYPMEALMLWVSRRLGRRRKPASG